MPSFQYILFKKFRIQSDREPAKRGILADRRHHCLACGRSASRRQNVIYDKVYGKRFATDSLYLFISRISGKYFSIDLMTSPDYTFSMLDMN